MGAIVSKPASLVGGALYPLYMTLKALRSGKPDAKQWVTYWIVLALTTSVESATEGLLARVPGYYSAKLAFLMWLMMPQTRGAVVLYDKVISPMLDRHEKQLDDKIRQLRDWTSSRMQKLRQHVLTDDTKLDTP